MSHGTVAARVCEHKKKHPHFYCKHRTCLWRVLHVVASDRPPHVNYHETPCPKHGGQEAPSVP